MAITLLFDLDDTLISNDVNVFLPAYFKLLGKQLAPFIAPDKMLPALNKAIYKMIQKVSPEFTLEEIFDQHFYPAIGYTKNELGSTINQFYQEIFPSLNYLTTPRPEAIQLVEEAFQAKHRVVIATNPTFPKTAILHRLNWAQLSPTQYNFEYVPSYETMHYCKPSPAYLAELLGILGWPPEPAVMIGNSLEEDILPANQLGLPAYWVTQSSDEFPSGLHPLNQKGTLHGVFQWLQTIENANSVQFDQIGDPLIVLNATPAALGHFKPHPNNTTLHTELAEALIINENRFIQKWNQVSQLSIPNIGQENSSQVLERWNKQRQSWLKVLGQKSYPSYSAQEKKLLQDHSAADRQTLSNFVPRLRPVSIFY
jgi:FMN phosphatase YigB (HAD superfamily)